MIDSVVTNPKVSNPEVNKESKTNIEPSKVEKTSPNSNANTIVGKPISEPEKVNDFNEPKPKLAIHTINKNNWHLALSYSGIEGNGLQVLLNSLAEYQQNENQDSQLVIRYLPKVVHFLTDSLEESVKASLRDYFEDENLKIVLKPKEELIKTPKDRRVARHENDVKEFCKQLTENLCVAKLQSELGAVIDKQTIKVKSKDF